MKNYLIQANENILKREECFQRGDKKEAMIYHDLVNLCLILHEVTKNDKVN